MHREGDRSDLQHPRSALGHLLLVVLVSAALPRLPGRPETAPEGQKTEIGDGRLEQEGRAERSGPGDGEEGGEIEVLAEHDPAGRSGVSGALGEEQARIRMSSMLVTANRPDRLPTMPGFTGGRTSRSAARRQYPARSTRTVPDHR